MKTLSCDVLLEKDLEADCWIGINLTLDVASQGETIEEAIEMIKEASENWMAVPILLTEDEINQRRTQIPEDEIEKYIKAKDFFALNVRYPDNFSLATIDVPWPESIQEAIELESKYFGFKLNRY